MVENGVSSEEVQHPVWDGAIIGFIGALETGMLRHLSQEQVIGTAGNILLDLMRNGDIEDFAVAQRYLEAHDLPMQLSAMPVSNQGPGFMAVDALSGEPKDYWLCISFGKDEIQRHFETNGIDRAENLQRLTDQTGFLAPRATTSPN